MNRQEAINQLLDAINELEQIPYGEFTPTDFNLIQGCADDLRNLEESTWPLVKHMMEE